MHFFAENRNRSLAAKAKRKKKEPATNSAIICLGLLCDQQFCDGVSLLCGDRNQGPELVRDDAAVRRLRLRAPGRRRRHRREDARWARRATKGGD
jgi:hypothetical protein